MKKLIATSSFLALCAVFAQQTQAANLTCPSSVSLDDVQMLFEQPADSGENVYKNKDIWREEKKLKGDNAKFNNIQYPMIMIQIMLTGDQDFNVKDFQNIRSKLADPVLEDSSATDCTFTMAGGNSTDKDIPGAVIYFDLEVDNGAKAAPDIIRKK